MSRDFLPVGLDTLQTWVNEQDALMLQYFAWRDGVYLLVLRPEAEPQAVKLQLDAEQAQALGVEPGTFIGRDLQKTYTFNQKRLAEAFKAPAARGGEGAEALHDRLALLWKVLLPAELRAGLTDGQYKRLVIVPDPCKAPIPDTFWNFFRSLCVLLSTTAISSYFEGKSAIFIGPWPLSIFFDGDVHHA